MFLDPAGWWVAIALIAAIREKLATSNVVPALKGMGITFIMTGLMAMAFQGFTGIKLAVPTGAGPVKAAGLIAPPSQLETEYSEPDSE